MPRRIQHARTTVSGNVPDPSDVLTGEIIINLADRTLRTKGVANDILRLNQHIIVTDTEVDDPRLGDWYMTTDGQIKAYFDNGSGLDWYDVAPPEDLSAYLPKTGGTMSGQITLPGGGSGSQAITVTETAAQIAAALMNYLAKAGGTMIGQLTLPGGGTGLQAITVSEVEAAIAAAIPPDLSNVLLKTGGVMSGQITLPGGATGNQAASANELSAAIAAHAAQPDPHTAYALTTELDTHIATGGSQHPAATGSTAGFMSAADKTRFDTMVVATAAEMLAGTNNAKFLTALALAGLWKKGSSVSGGGTITFGDGGYFHITGSGWTCTDFDFTVPFDGRSVQCVADGTGTITHHATTLVCPGGDDIDVEAGDSWTVTQDATDNVRITDYQRATGLPVIEADPPTNDTLFDGTLVGAGSSKIFDNSIITKAYTKFELILSGLSTSSGVSATGCTMDLSGNNGAAWVTGPNVGEDLGGSGTDSSVVQIFNTKPASALRTVIVNKASGGGTIEFDELSVTTGEVDAIRLRLSSGSFDGSSHAVLIGYP